MKQIQIITKEGIPLTLVNPKFYYVKDSPKWMQKDFQHLIKFLMKQNYEITIDGSAISFSKVTAQKEKFEISLILKEIEKAKE